MVMKKLNLFLATIAFHGIKRDLTVHLVCAIVEENNFNIQTAQLPYAGGINTNTKYKYKVYKTHPTQNTKEINTAHYNQNNQSEGSQSFGKHTIFPPFKG